MALEALALLVVTGGRVPGIRVGGRTRAAFAAYATLLALLVMAVFSGELTFWLRWGEGGREGLGEEGEEVAGEA